MNRQRIVWSVLMISIGSYLISWLLWGWPASHWLIRWCMQTGIMSSNYNVDDPMRFWRLSTVLAIVAGGVVGMNGLLLFWGLKQNQPRKPIVLIVFISLWSLFAAQITMGTIDLCYPQYNWVEVLGGGLWAGGTRYAPGFTKIGFVQVQIGMSRKEVENLIGRGFLYWMGSLEYDAPLWKYSQPKGRIDSYWLYRIDFKDNVVSYKRMTFWTD